MARILVVDDEDVIRKLLKDFLEERGHDVRTAKDGKEALEEMEEAPEIVLLDIVLPDMDGIEVLDGIKEMAPSTDVIMVTALVKHAVGIESMRRGAFDFMTKPIDLKNLEELTNFGLMQKSL